MARHEPHMSAAYGHLEQAKPELDKAAPNKGGHREKAIQLVEQAMKQGETYPRNDVSSSSNKQAQPLQVSLGE